MAQRRLVTGKSRVVFATGCGRSGTTAMRTALSAHPDLISSSIENNIVGDLLQTCDHNATLESRRFAMQMREESHESLFAQLMLDLVFPGYEIAGEQRRALFATWLTPRSAQRAIKLFPDAQFVLIVRDGVATIESRLAHHSLGQGTFESQCREWASWGVFHDWALDRADCLIIRHERLVADPASTIASVTDFLGLAEHPAPAAVLQSQRFHPTPASTRPSSKNWSDADRQAFERLCASAMDAMGYPIPWLVIDQPERTLTAQS